VCSELLNTMVHSGPKGSPRLILAATRLAWEPNRDTTDVLLESGYKKDDIARNRKKALSRQRLKAEQEIKERKMANRKKQKHDN